MKIKDLANGKDHVRKGCREEVANNHLGKKVYFKPADIIWVKNRGGSWWPGQVVDENLISESSKQGNRSAGKVLVRLYGTYTYLYVDPTKCGSEFDTILKQNNGSHRKIFLKAVEQDIARLKAGQSKSQGSKSKDSSSAKHHDQDELKKNLKRSSTSSMETKKRKGEKHDGVQKKLEKNDRSTLEAASKRTPKHDKRTPKHDEVLIKKRKLNDISSPDTMSSAKSRELSARRLKVMQSLGLAAPPGSPFCKNGQLYITL